VPDKQILFLKQCRGEDLPHKEADPLAFKLVSCPSPATLFQTFKNLQRSNNAVPCQQQLSAPRKLENPSAMNLKYVLTIFIRAGRECLSYDEKGFEL
jgi:hypothetical protein